MAGLGGPDEMRREIQVLAAENEELKQLVQLLLENQDLRSLFRNQRRESTAFLPVHESTRLDGQDHFGSQPLLDSASFPLPVRPPLSNTAQLATPPRTPGGAGPVFVGQLPLAGGRRDSAPPSLPHMFTPPPLSPGAVAVGPPPQAPRAPWMQQFHLPQFHPPPAARLNFQSPSQNLLRLGSPGTPGPGTQGTGYVSPNSSSQDSSFRSDGGSPGRLRGQGYCIECAVPFHPHLPQGSLADSAMSDRSHLSSPSLDASARNFSSSSAVPGNQRSAAAGPPYGPGSPQSISQLPGLPLLGTPPLSPAGATLGLAARPPYPASPQHVSASFSSIQSSQSGDNSPRTPQQGNVPFSPSYTQSFSPSGFAYGPEICSQSPAGKIPPSYPGARTLEMLAPQSPAPYCTFPFSLKPSPSLPQPPPQPKTKACRESDRQATSPTMTKPSKDSKPVSMERIVGEIAFQLDRRILSAIFPDRVRLYGFTVRNIPEKMRQDGNEAQSGLTEDQRWSMMERYNTIMSQLKPLGYDPNTHPRVTEQIVNTYGILRERPDMRGPEGDIYNNREYLCNIVQATVPSPKRADCLMLLNCLHKLSQDDRKPLFIW